MPSSSPSPHATPLTLTPQTLSLILSILSILPIIPFITITILYFTGCFITETSIITTSSICHTTASSATVDKNSKRKDRDGEGNVLDGEMREMEEGEEKALSELKKERNEEDVEEVIETHWRTTKVRVWGWEVVLWSVGRRRPRVDWGTAREGNVQKDEVVGESCRGVEG
ncbi:hypothetical protein ONS95_005316 [Cadophora gregata]|uniref:uncharacterized protein n=1 Tax=Cadophora gregata TaxID=51156 RepID=UPI0026DDABA6|nr:uncharacterized protein ONS95_005316 [Cadophora gregata]KAK0103281.1 hypothetical protein ONS95_005316 [Cadophora gregata]KAK0107476.1 hypothetical protein ONS96_003290 [Cadophora gregata f. sp. sojae]